MKDIHFQEHDQFVKLFETEGISNMSDRLNVLDVFLQTEQHVTSDELFQALVNKGHDIKPEFIRETLGLMCRFGFASQNRFDNGQIRYEHRHLGFHHDHMICTKCKNIIEFKNDQLEQLQAQIARSHNFHMLQHKMEIYGICSNCLENRVKLMPLNVARQGERLVIESFSGGSGARARLMAMGLKIGDTVDVITNIHSGQVVIAIDQNRLILGRGLAQKVIVRVV